MNAVDLFSAAQVSDLRRLGGSRLLCEFLWRDLIVQRGQDPADIDIYGGGGGGLLVVTSHYHSLT